MLSDDSTLSILKTAFSIFALAATLLLLPGAATAQVGGTQKISDTSGSFDGTLADSDVFGTSLAALSDLDGDGVDDLSVGAEGSAGGGAVWNLFLDTDGTVLAEESISNLGNSSGDLFGCSVAYLGDHDGDGEDDIAGGNKVTLIGRCFSKTTTVSFGGVPGPSVTFVNSGELSVEVPALPLPSRGTFGGFVFASRPYFVAVDVTVTDGADQDSISLGYIYR